MNLGLGLPRIEKISKGGRENDLTKNVFRWRDLGIVIGQEKMM